MRKVLGQQVDQKGSLVDDGKTRFDFTHDKPLTAEDIRAIADLVRGRNGAVEDLRRWRQRLQGMLLRLGHRYPGKGRSWTLAYRAYITQLVWAQEAHQLLCQIGTAPGKFFRPNRSMIIQSTSIQQIKPYINGRLKLSLKVAKNLVDVLVSRERVNAFRFWAEQ